ncbi:hypothetical protein N9L68_00685 [bacterium]|nr:hypothetical protein [bacterium]
MTEPVTAVVTEYEVALNTSVSGERKEWARGAFGQPRLFMRDLRLLTLAHLARSTGCSLLWCPRCGEAETIEFCQHVGCNLG